MNKMLSTLSYLQIIHAKCITAISLSADQTDDDNDDINKYSNMVRAIFGFIAFGPWFGLPKMSCHICLTFPTFSSLLWAKTAAGRPRLKHKFFPRSS